MAERWQGAQGHSEQGGGVEGHLCSQPVLNPCKFKITIAPCGKPLVIGALEPRGQLSQPSRVGEDCVTAASNGLQKLSGQEGEKPSSRSMYS
jgi:hypothetical protein